jgi:hypothetical protein
MANVQAMFEQVVDLPSPECGLETIRTWMFWLRLKNSRLVRIALKLSAAELLGRE